MKHLILILLLLTGTAFTQSWTSVIETDVDVSNALDQSVDLFANGDGLHIIYKESNSLKYCKLDVDGDKDPDSPVTLENTSVVSPSITGDATRIYVVYRKTGENYIRTKYSTNGGSSWRYLSRNPSNSNADNIESVLSEGKLHVTFEVSNQVKYSNNSLSGGPWATPYTVSNLENGNLPRITAWNGNSEDKIYFLYRNTSTLSKWREYNVTSNSGSSIKTAFSVSTSYPAGFAADGSNITIFYSYWSSPNYYFDSVVRNKSNNNIVSNCTAELNQTYKVYSTTTVDEEVHIPFWFNYLLDEEFEPGLYRSKGGCTLDNIYWNVSQNAVYQILNVSSSSNDVYVIWQDNLGSSNGDNLRLIYDDADPLQPQGLAVESYEVENETYAKVSWTFNNEPDVRANNDGYLIERRTKPYGGSWSSWSQIGTTGGATHQYIDYGITNIGADKYTAEYRIRAKDIGNNISVYSSTVSITFGQFSKLSVGITKYNYNLDQNYPNPFNPSTQISYSLAQDAFVTVKVYDMLGNEVANLVDEKKTAGYYSVDFNAANLPSGIYFYRITSGNFTKSKKLILLK